MVSEPEGSLVPDLETVEPYRVARELADLVYELEDRYPDDQIRLLYQPLCSVALQVGARIAEGFGRYGLDSRGGLSEETKRQVSGKLSELRHYVSVSAKRYFLDENHVRALQELDRRIQAFLLLPAPHDRSIP